MLENIPIGIIGGDESECFLIGTRVFVDRTS